MNKIITGVLVAIVLAALWGISFYNGLVGKSQNIDQQWAQVETQYQRRLDLIPNLVNSVQGVMKQEQTIFADLANARSNYAGAKTTEEKSNAAQAVDSALSRLLVIVENYPQLKSNENVNKLMDELAGTENRIAVERKRYNDSVRDYNGTIKTFPANLLAPALGFSEKSYFQAASGAETAPKVDLTN